MARPGGTNEELRLSDLQSGFLVGDGRFTLNEELRVTTETAVWKATDNQLDEKVVLKFFSSEIVSSSLAGALRSRLQLARKLSHPHIARTHDLYFVPGELPFVASEFVEGVDLDSARSTRPDGIFSWAELHPLVQQVCEAIQYAHREDVVHGRLKANQVMLGPHHRVKILGFAAPAFSGTLLHGGALPLTADILPYSSAQLLNGNPPAPPDDIFSLAATVYELLTGRPPFWTGDIQHQILTARTPRLSEHAFENGVAIVLPGYIEDLWFAALSRDPSHRPDAKEVCEVLAKGPGSDTSTNVETNIEPISLMPPSQNPPPPVKQRTAVEEAEEFEKTLPQEFEERGTSAKVSRYRGVLIGGAVLIAGIAVAWQFERYSKDSRGEYRSHIATETVTTSETSSKVSSPSIFPRLTLDLGRGPVFTYEYRPQKALALDTNAINHSVKSFARQAIPRLIAASL